MQHVSCCMHVRMTHACAALLCVCVSRVCCRLDGSHVIVGRVIHGMDIVRRLELLGDIHTHAPKRDVCIIACGRVKKKEMARLESEAEQSEAAKKEKMSTPR